MRLEIYQNKHKNNTSNNNINTTSKVTGFARSLRCYTEAVELRKSLGTPSWQICNARDDSLTYLAEAEANTLLVQSCKLASSYLKRKLACNELYVA